MRNPWNWLTVTVQPWKWRPYVSTTDTLLWLLFVSPFIHWQTKTFHFRALGIMVWVGPRVFEIGLKDNN